MGWQPPQNSCAWRFPQWQQCLRAREAAAAPLCAPLTRNSSSCLLTHPTLPLLLGGFLQFKFWMCLWLSTMICFYSLTTQWYLQNTNQLGHLTGGQTSAIQGFRESKAIRCCHYSTSWEYPVSLHLPTSHPKCASKQSLCSLNRVATVYAILPHLFFAPAVPGRRCHWIVSLFL